MTPAFAEILAGILADISLDMVIFCLVALVISYTGKPQYAHVPGCD